MGWIDPDCTGSIRIDPDRSASIRIDVDRRGLSGASQVSGSISTIFTILSKLALKNQLFGQNAPGLCFIGSRQAILVILSKKAKKYSELLKILKK